MAIVHDAEAYLELGRTQLQAVCRSRSIIPPDIGTHEVAMVVENAAEGHKENQAFLNQLMLNRPHHTGMGPWLDLRGGDNVAVHPYVMDRGWESLIVDLNDTFRGGAHFEFWRIEPAGRFYDLTGLRDDLPDSRIAKPAPLTGMDFFAQIQRVAEEISVGQHFATAMGCDPCTTNLEFAFSWSGLRGRELTSWVAPGRFFPSPGQSHQDEMTTTLTVPLDSTPRAVARLVEAALAPLFALFGGMTFQSEVFDDIVIETLKRRM